MLSYCLNDYVKSAVYQVLKGLNALDLIGPKIMFVKDGYTIFANPYFNDLSVKYDGEFIPPLEVPFNLESELLRYAICKANHTLKNQC